VTAKKIGRELKRLPRSVAEGVSDLKPDAASVIFDKCCTTLRRGKVSFLQGKKIESSYRKIEARVSEGDGERC